MHTGPAPVTTRPAPNMNDTVAVAHSQEPTRDAAMTKDEAVSRREDL